jgi:hypothetical protein
MNPINLLIQFIDGTSRETTAIVADLMAFEDKFDKSVADLSKGVRLSWLVFIAWSSEVRTKSTTLDFNSYAETIQGVEVAEIKK